MDDFDTRNGISLDTFGAQKMFRRSELDLGKHLLMQQVCGNVPQLLPPGFPVPPREEVV